MKLINPFNFVPLHSEKPGMAGKDGGKTYTGKIVYELKTISPLFIPNTSEDEAFSVSTPEKAEKGEEFIHKSMDFFSYNDLQTEITAEGKKYWDSEPHEPVIPGSEIRGAVRSVYEALTDSCLSFIDTDSPLSKRTPEQYRPGVIKWDGDVLKLYKIDWQKDDHLLRDPDFSVKYFKSGGLPTDGSEVYFSLSSLPRDPHSKKLVARVDDGKFPGSAIGYLVKGQEGPELGKPAKNPKCGSCPGSTKAKCASNGEKNCYLLEKHCAHVFSVPDETEAKVLDDKEIYLKQIDRILGLYDQNSPGGYSEYKESWEKFKNKNQDGIAVYYSEVAGHYYLSPACITREVYFNTLKECIKGYEPCHDRDCLCPACSLFGMMNTRENVTSMSRIRFGDARLVNPDAGNVYFEKNNGIIMLPEMSSPKLSATEFYLQKPEKENRAILNWTYDYFVYLDGNGVPKLQWNTPTISGRKFYWHSPRTFQEEVLKKQQQIEKTKRNRSVRPVKEGTSFEGELYFDGVTEKELNQLVALMNISASEEGNYGIKLGGGKPFGMGSVALKVTNVFIRSLEEGAGGINIHVQNVTDERKKKASDYKSLFSDISIFKILSLDALNAGEMAGYLRKAEGDEGFKWFVDNRKACAMDRINRKRGILYETLHTDRIDNGPRSRRQIVFREYIQPLESSLSRNDALAQTTQAGQEDADRNNAGRVFANDCIISINKKKGFAFIKTGQGDLFAHCSAFQMGEFDGAENGMKVEYERGEGRDGRPCAVKVRILRE